MIQAGKFVIKPAFLACAIILAVSAAGKDTLIRILGYQLTKLPIQLKHPLDQLDEKKLEPYQVRNKQKIDNPDVLESLGTEQYLQWTLEDRESPAGSPVQYCSLFITYYTGNPDMVPHVPDECYVGGGNQRLSASQISVDLPEIKKNEATGSLASIPKSIPFQYVLFSRQDKNSLTPETKFSVQYFFKSNGEFCGSRTETRTVLGKNFLCKYSYFAKVEWKFYGFDYSGMNNPTKEQTLEATRKLFLILLPILEEDHWPDWEKALRNEVQ